MKHLMIGMLPGAVAASGSPLEQDSRAAGTNNWAGIECTRVATREKA
jgi:hypothetical protein